MTSLNTSDLKPAPGAAPLRRPRVSLNPVQLFVDMNLAARFWFVTFLVSNLLIHLPRLWPAAPDRERYILVDGAGNVLVTRATSFGQSRQLHEQQAVLATQAFLNRTPTGFDNPDLLEVLFLSDALGRARQQLADEAPERAAKQLHQKVEIGPVEIIETRDQFVRVHVTGQLVRTGIFHGESFGETVPFKLSLNLLRNPNLILNGRFPTAVQSFTYATQ